MHKLTVKQAAEALGVSPKTIRRRIGEGELSASKELRGKQEVVLIDGAELARYAEGANLRLSIDRVGQQPVGVDFSNGLEGAPVPPEGTQDPMRPMIDQGTNVDKPGNDGQDGTFAVVVTELRAALDESRRREAWLQERVQVAEAAAERERERASEERQRLMELIPKALPPAPPWWRRIFRSGNQGGNDDA